MAVFMFDSSSPDNFRRAHNLLVAVSTWAGDTLPCLLMAAKDDLGMSQVGRGARGGGTGDGGEHVVIAVHYEHNIRSIGSTAVLVLCF